MCTVNGNYMRLKDRGPSEDWTVGPKAIEHISFGWVEKRKMESARRRYRAATTYVVFLTSMG
jgi:hypothetical protein